jgi:hypothetical protein
MKPKLDSSVYSVPQVKDACERANARFQAKDKHWSVWLDPDVPERIFTTPSDEPLELPLVCVFDTADGGKLF